MPRWLLGGLVVVLKAILQIMGAILWSAGLPIGSITPFWAHLGPFLGPSWPFVGASGGQIGPKMGLPGHILGHVGQSWGPLGGPRGVRESILRWNLGLEALIWILHVARRPRVKAIPTTNETHQDSIIF